MKLPNTKRKKHPQRESYLIPTLRRLCGNWVWFLKVLKSFRLVVTKYSIQRGVQIENCVNEPNTVRVICCKVNCKWLLYESLDKKTNSFVIKTYMPVHSCQKASRNYLCNSKFIAIVFKKKIIEQQNITVQVARVNS